MLMNNSMKNSLHAHYSPTAQASLGYKFEYWRKNQFSLNLVQMNNNSNGQYNSMNQGSYDNSHHNDNGGF